MQNETAAPAVPGVPAAAKLQKCTTFADFLRLLDNGAMHAELSALLPDIAAAMQDFAAENGGKASAKLKLDIKFKLDKGVFEIYPEHKAELPKVKPNRTIAWVSPDNFFTPQNPAQIEMFGVRAVNDGYAGQGGEPLRQV